MKKKSFRKLASLFTLACIMSAFLVLPVQAATLNPVTPEVTEMLNNVLSSELEIVKTGKSKDYSSVINESKLLQSIQKEEKYKENWYSDISFKIDDYTSNVKVNNVTQLSDKKYDLDITFQAELILSKDLQIHPKTSEDYVCEIENKSGQWVINKLISKVDYQDIVKEKNNNITLANGNVIEPSADILANNDTILDAKSKDLQIRSTNIDASVKSYKEMMQGTKNTHLNGSEKATPSYAGTNSYAIANYAAAHGIDHNLNYYYYTSAEGGDCTNFASQAVHEGGVPTTSYWGPYTNNWIRVLEFHTYIINNGYAYDGNVNNITLGDVVQWRHAYWDWSHSTIASYYSDTYGWLLSAHTNDRSNYPISMYWGDYSYNRDFWFW